MIFSTNLKLPARKGSLDLDCSLLWITTKVAANKIYHSDQALILTKRFLPLLAKIANYANYYYFKTKQKGKPATLLKNRSYTCDKKTIMQWISTITT